MSSDTAVFIPPPEGSFLSPKAQLISSSDRGRILVAIQSLSPGEIIIAEEPYAAIVAEAYQGSRCAWCFGPLGPERVFALSSSDPCRYCSEGCITK